MELMAVKLLETARKLPPGPDRQKTFRSIERFRLRVAALQRSCGQTRELKVKGK
jgi:hypothetical protein